MYKFNTSKQEKNRILKLHLQESTSTKSAGAYIDPKSWSDGGILTQNNSTDGIVGVELGLALPDVVDITGGNVGGFEDAFTCPTCGQMDGSCPHSEDVDDDMDLFLPIDEPEKEISDFLPDSLLNLFGDVEIEMMEEPKKMRGSRKWRK